MAGIAGALALSGLSWLALHKQPTDYSHPPDPAQRPTEFVADARKRLSCRVDRETQTTLPCHETLEVAKTIQALGKLAASGDASAEELLVHLALGPSRLDPAYLEEFEGGIIETASEEVLHYSPQSEKDDTPQTRELLNKALAQAVAPYLPSENWSQEKVRGLAKQSLVQGQLQLYWVHKRYGENVLHATETGGLFVFGATNELPLFLERGQITPEVVQQGDHVYLVELDSTSALGDSWVRELYVSTLDGELNPLCLITYSSESGFTDHMTELDALSPYQMATAHVKFLSDRCEVVNKDKLAGVVAATESDTEGL
jgi:hypothetical protein